MRLANFCGRLGVIRLRMSYNCPDPTGRLLCDHLLSTSCTCSAAGGAHHCDHRRHLDPFQLIPSSAAAQSGSVGDDGGAVLLTPWGDPDLQGIWTHGTITPLERPEEYAGRELLTEEEVAALNHASDTRAEQREGLSAEQDVALAYNQFWWDRGISIGRTSLLVDPPDGRLPARVPEAERVATSAETQRIRAIRRGNLPASGPEEMDLGDRCLVYRPVPITSSGYNNNVQIAQSPGYVAILQEQIHEVRVIPLDGRPELGPAVDQWLGVSRGHWEDNTLVVETTNFRDDAVYLGSSTSRHVVERLTRMSDGTIR